MSFERRPLHPCSRPVSLPTVLQSGGSSCWLTWEGVSTRSSPTFYAEAGSSPSAAVYSPSGTAAACTPPSPAGAYSPAAQVPAAAAASPHIPSAITGTLHCRDGSHTQLPHAARPFVAAPRDSLEGGGGSSSQRMGGHAARESSTGIGTSSSSGYSLLSRGRSVASGSSSSSRMLRPEASTVGTYFCHSFNSSNTETCLSSTRGLSSSPRCLAGSAEHVCVRAPSQLVAAAAAARGEVARDGLAAWDAAAAHNAGLALAAADDQQEGDQELLAFNSKAAAAGAAARDAYGEEEAATVDAVGGAPQQFCQRAAEGAISPSAARNTPEESMRVAVESLPVFPAVRTPDAARNRSNSVNAAGHAFTADLAAAATAGATGTAAAGRRFVPRIWVEEEEQIIEVLQQRPVQAPPGTVPVWVLAGQRPCTPAVSPRVSEQPAAVPHLYTYTLKFIPISSLRAAEGLQASLTYDAAEQRQHHRQQQQQQQGVQQHRVLPILHGPFLFSPQQTDRQRFRQLFHRRQQQQQPRGGVRPRGAAVGHPAHSSSGAPSQGLLLQQRDTPRQRQSTPKLLQRGGVDRAAEEVVMLLQSFKDDPASPAAAAVAAAAAVQAAATAAAAAEGAAAAADIAAAQSARITDDAASSFRFPPSLTSEVRAPQHPRTRSPSAAAAAGSLRPVASPTPRPRGKTNKDGELVPLQATSHAPTQIRRYRLKHQQINAVCSAASAAAATSVKLLRPLIACCFASSVSPRGPSLLRRGRAERMPAAAGANSYPALKEADAVTAEATAAQNAGPAFARRGGLPAAYVYTTPGAPGAGRVQLYRGPTAAAAAAAAEAAEAAAEATESAVKATAAAALAVERAVAASSTAGRGGGGSRSRKSQTGEPLPGAATAAAREAEERTAAVAARAKTTNSSASSLFSRRLPAARGGGADAAGRQCTRIDVKSLAAGAAAARGAAAPERRCASAGARAPLEAGAAGGKMFVTSALESSVAAAPESPLALTVLRGFEEQQQSSSPASLRCPAAAAPPLYPPLHASGSRLLRRGHSDDLYCPTHLFEVSGTDREHSGAGWQPPLLNARALFPLLQQSHDTAAAAAEHYYLDAELAAAAAAAAASPAAAATSRDGRVVHALQLVSVSGATTRPCSAHLPQSCCSSSCSNCSTCSGWEQRQQFEGGAGKEAQKEQQQQQQQQLTMDGKAVMWKPHWKLTHAQEAAAKPSAATAAAPAANARYTAIQRLEGGAAAEGKTGTRAAAAATEAAGVKTMTFAAAAAAAGGNFADLSPLRSIATCEIFALASGGDEEDDSSCCSRSAAVRHSSAPTDSDMLCGPVLPRAPAGTAAGTAARKENKQEGGGGSTAAAALSAAEGRGSAQLERALAEEEAAREGGGEAAAAAVAAVDQLQQQERSDNEEVEKNKMREQQQERGGQQQQDVQQSLESAVAQGKTEAICGAAAGTAAQKRGDNSRSSPTSRVEKGCSNQREASAWHQQKQHKELRSSRRTSVSTPAAAPTLPPNEEEEGVYGLSEWLLMSGASLPAALQQLLQHSSSGSVQPLHAAAAEEESTHSLQQRQLRDAAAADRKDSSGCMHQADAATDERRATEEKAANNNATAAAAPASTQGAATGKVLREDTWATCSALCREQKGGTRAVAAGGLLHEGGGENAATAHAAEAEAGGGGEGATAGAAEERAGSAAVTAAALEEEEEVKEEDEEAAAKRRVRELAIEWEARQAAAAAAGAQSECGSSSRSWGWASPVAASASFGSTVSKTSSSPLGSPRPRASTSVDRLKGISAAALQEGAVEVYARYGSRVAMRYLQQLRRHSAAAPLRAEVPSSPLSVRSGREFAARALLGGGTAAAAAPSGSDEEEKSPSGVASNGLLLQQDKGGKDESPLAA